MVFDNEKNNYTLYGVLFGLTFPIGAIGLELFLRDLSPNLSSIIYLHQEVVLLWMIDTAPLVLGAFARIAGIKQDNLTASLENMQQTINERTHHLELSRDLAEKQAVEKQQLSELSQISTRAKDSKNLAQEALAYIISITESRAGIVYLCQDNKLNYLASYAFTENEDHQKEMPYGETLLGQCAVEKKVFHIQNLKPGYLNIESSIGSASANSIVLLPLIFEGELLGIMELGSFGKYSDEEVERLKKAADVVAISLFAALNQEKLTSLVKQLKSN